MENIKQKVSECIEVGDYLAARNHCAGVISNYQNGTIQLCKEELLDLSWLCLRTVACRMFCEGAEYYDQVETEDYEEEYDYFVVVDNVEKEYYSLLAIIRYLPLNSDDFLATMKKYFSYITSLAISAVEKVVVARSNVNDYRSHNALRYHLSICSCLVNEFEYFQNKEFYHSAMEKYMSNIILENTKQFCDIFQSRAAELNNEVLTLSFDLPYFCEDDAEKVMNNYNLSIAFMQEVVGIYPFQPSQEPDSYPYGWPDENLLLYYKTLVIALVNIMNCQKISNGKPRSIVWQGEMRRYYFEKLQECKEFYDENRLDYNFPDVYLQAKY